MRRDYQQNETSAQDQDNFQKIDREIKLGDLYNMLCLKPLQIKLDEVKGNLPTGLKIVDRKTQTQYDIIQIGKQKLLTFEEYLNKKSQKQSIVEGKKQLNYLDYLKTYHGDNLLSQMKAHATPLQMAYCICMYNEDKSMLMNTLKGVGANILNLYKQGVDPDKNVVIIVQDGIQKMNQQIKLLFQILENQSCMRFNTNKQQKWEQKITKLSKLQQIRKQDLIQDEDSITDLSSFIFPAEQLEARKKIRFLNVKKQYDDIKKLQQQVKDLRKKKNLTSPDLSGIILEFYEKLCYQNHTGEPYPGNTLNQNAKNIVHEFYSDDIKKSKPFIQGALKKAQLYCKEYISSRMDMAHVSFFRTSMFFPYDSIIQQDEETQAHSSPLLSGTDIRSSVKYRKISSQAIKMNIFFVVKYQNAQKLSSHNWFFNGFCKEFCDFSKEDGKMKCISPKYTILLDVGLRPDDDALVKMYNVMQNHQQIGGVCGYMNLKLEKQQQSQGTNNYDLDIVSRFCLNFVDIQRAQQLQYHFAHLIDKGFQSIFKFIHVLPGAFSGYNMKAIWGQIDPKAGNNNNADRLLKDYFSSIGQKLSNQSYSGVQFSIVQVLCRILLPNLLIKQFFPYNKKTSSQQLLYSSNVNLAQDRILCMGIHKNNKALMFLPDAASFVDPVKDIPNLLGQRKRWINGSYFAFDKVSDQFRQTEGCCHVIGIQINYLAFMNLLAYIAPGFYLFTISVAMQAFKADVLTKFFQDTLSQDSQIYGAFVYTINFIYTLLIGGLIFYSFNITNKQPRFIRYVYALSSFLGIMSMIIMTILLVDIIRGLLGGVQSQSYLIANSNFVSQIPGGQSTIDILRYIVLGIISLYIIPIVFYSGFFGTLRVLIQIIAGSISFIFYQPSYLIILSSYALCRMDDLSWGTKGLQAGANNQNSIITSSWNKIKTLHVAKYIFWNIIVAGLLIHFGSNYLVRFYLTFALMIIMGATMLIKVLLAVAYYIYYKYRINNKPKKKDRNINIDNVPCLYKNFDPDTYGQNNLGAQLRQIIRKNAQKLKKQCGSNNNSILAMQFIAMRGMKKNNQLQNMGLQNIFSGIKSMIKASQQDKKDKDKFKKPMGLLKPIQEQKQEYFDKKRVNNNNVRNEREQSQSSENHLTQVQTTHMKLLPRNLAPIDHSPEKTNNTKKEINQFKKPIKFV